MSNPKYQIGDRVQVIAASGEIIIPDSFIKYIHLMQKGAEFIVKGARHKSKYDAWTYATELSEYWHGEFCVHPYPEDQLDPAYERMINGIEFGIGETV